MISRFAIFDVHRLMYMKSRRAFLLVLMLAFSGGCKSRAPLNTPPTSSAAHFDGVATALKPPLRRLLLMARKGQHAEDVEAFFKTQVLPILKKDNRVGDIAIYVTEGDNIPLYGLQVDLRTWDMPAPNLALAILSAGWGSAAAATLRDNLMKFLDLDSATILYLRPELSISHDVVGAAGGF